MFLLGAMLLTGCSLMGDESNEPANPEKDAVEDTNADEPASEDLTAEEKLIQQLPTSASAADWNLLLVNPDQALPENFTVELEEVDNEQQIDARIVEAWTNLRTAANEAGHRLFLASAYRDVARQEANFNQKVNTHISEGLTEEEARKKAKEYLTEPGHSEHHTGLALDIVDEEWIVAGNRLDPEYEGELSQQWLVENMTDYGFILRYPKGKETITQIEYEPWHFRYVGTENATFMVEHDLTLEEYVALLIQADR